MKKIYKICLIIILIGIAINIVLYANKSNTDVNTNNNKQTEKNKNEQKNKQKDKQKSEEKNDKTEEKKQDKFNDYFNINRKKLDRPIAYMINNIPQAWPQSGIYGADYIYELQVEGGLTRLMAIFTRGEVDKIGPIRSARHDFLNISMEYNAIFSHFGGSPQAFRDINKLNIPSLNGIVLDGIMYWRDNSRRAPHNSYTNIQKTLAYAKKYGYNKKATVDHFSFKDNVMLDGKKANKIDIHYSHAHNTSYIYDEQNKVYKRFMRGKPHIDQLINTQLTAKNIIVQFAKHVSIDDKDRQDISLVGSGKGYFITNGKCINITWHKPSRRQKTIYYNEQGDRLILNNGQTWVQIVPLDSRITIR